MSSNEYADRIRSTFRLQTTVGFGEDLRSFGSGTDPVGALPVPERPFRVGVLDHERLAFEPWVRGGSLMPGQIEIAAVAETGSIEELIAADLDGVIVAMPPKLQLRMAMQAMEHGLHVLCVGGLGDCLADVVLMERYAGAAGLNLEVGHLDSAPLSWVRGLVRAKAIGTLRRIEARSLRRATGDRELDAQICDELMDEMISSVVSIVHSAAEMVAPRRWGGDTKQDAVVDFDGARAHLYADCDRGVEADESTIRFQGDRGWVEVPMPVPGDDPAVFWPTLVEEHGEAWCGEPPVPADVSAGAQELSWAQACLRLGREPSDLKPPWTCTGCGKRWPTRTGTASRSSCSSAAELSQSEFIHERSCSK